MAHYRSSVSCCSDSKSNKHHQDDEVQDDAEETDKCFTNLTSAMDLACKEDKYESAKHRMQKQLLLSCCLCAKLFKDKSYLNKHLRWHKKVQENRKKENVIIQHGCERNNVR